MNIFGMGPTEILLILVLALIVFGPAKLPEIMGQVGRAIADFRRATGQLSDEFNRTIQAELNETRQVVEDTRAALNDAKATVTQTHAAVTGAVTAAPQRVAVPAAEAAATPSVNGTTVEPHPEPNGTTAVVAPPVAPPAPPLADTSQWSWESSASPTAPATANGSMTSSPESSLGSATTSPESSLGSATTSPEGPLGSATTSPEGSHGSATTSPEGSRPAPSARSARDRGPGRDELLPPY
jgi:sec-independent protein translocase protein TatB